MPRNILGQISVNSDHLHTLLKRLSDNNRKFIHSEYYLRVNPEEQVQEAVDAIEWIHSAGKVRRERMYASKVENDFANEEVSIWFLGAVFNRIGNIEGEVLINDLPTLFVDNFELEDQEWLHPEIYLPMGKAISIIARFDATSLSYEWIEKAGTGERIAIVAATRDPDTLALMSNDPCVIVRAIVAVNSFTTQDVKQKLRKDTFFDVRRRTLYGDTAAINDFDAERDSIKSGEVVAPENDNWPGHCPCRPRSHRQ